MKTKGAILFSLVAAALVAHGGEKAIQSGQTLVFMGDSITDYGASRSHGYPNLVVKGLAANGIHVTWYGAGIAGDTSADMLGRFDADVIAKNPDVVTISAGVNDCWFNKATYEQFCTNELAMVAKAKAAGAKAVLLSPTTAGGETDRDDIRRFAAGVREIADDEGLAYAPTFEMLRDWIDDRDKPALTLMNGNGLRATYDGTHMAPAGDRVLARATLRGLGLDLEELALAEAAWNADESLVPLIAPPSSTSTIRVNLTAAEAQAVSGLTLKQILDRGIPSLAANPTLEAEASGASTTMTVTPTTGTFTYKAYDQLLLSARALGIRVDEAIKCAILRGARSGETPSPRGPVAMVNDILVGSDRATFDATIESVGATAGSCDVLLRYGTSAGNLGAATRMAVGENGSFFFVLGGLQPATKYYYEATFLNNATTPMSSVVSGSFTTKAASGAIQPSGWFDSDAIQAAIDAAAPSHGTVTLGEGCFSLGAELMVTGGVTLVGQGMTKTILRQTAAHRVMTIKDGSRVEGLTMEGAKTTVNWANGAGAMVLDGTISRCRIWRNHAGYAGSNIYGGGVYFEKGSIDHSIVAFNTAGGNAAAGGGIAWRYSGGAVTIDTCLVYGNSVPNGNGGGIAVLMGNPAVTIRNTTIAGNSAGAKGGGLSDETYNHTVKLVNCIVSGNTAAAGEADVNGTISSASSNNLVGGAPAFFDAANNDYRLTANSPAKGAGTAYEGIGTDLDGAAFADPPSIGCYEYDGSAPPPAARPRVMFSID